MAHRQRSRLLFFCNTRTFVRGEHLLLHGFSLTRFCLDRGEFLFAKRELVYGRSEAICTVNACIRGDGVIGCASGVGTLYDMLYGSVGGADMGRLEGAYAGLAEYVFVENGMEGMPAEAKPGRKKLFMSSPC